MVHNSFTVSENSSTFLSVPCSKSADKLPPSKRIKYMAEKKCRIWLYELLITCVSLERGHNVCSCLHTAFYPETPCLTRLSAISFMSHVSITLVARLKKNWCYIREVASRQLKTIMFGSLNASQSCIAHAEALVKPALIFSRSSRRMSTPENLQPTRLLQSVVGTCWTITL